MTQKTYPDLIMVANTEEYEHALDLGWDRKFVVRVNVQALVSRRYRNIHMTWAGWMRVSAKHDVVERLYSDSVVMVTTLTIGAILPPWLLNYDEEYSLGRGVENGTIHQQDPRVRVANEDEGA